MLSGDPFTILRMLTLALVLVPVLGCILLLISMFVAPKIARNVANTIAVLHLVVTLCTVLMFVVRETDLIGGDGVTISMANKGQTVNFQPTGVPGDPGINESASTESHGTTWTLLNLGDMDFANSGVQFFLGIDGLNIFLIGLTSITVFLAVLLTPITRTEPTYYLCIVLCLLFATLAFLAFDALLFFIFFELVIIPSSVLVAKYGTGERRLQSAKFFFIMSFIGSLFTLIGIVGVAYTNPVPTVETVDNNGDKVKTVSYITDLRADGEPQELKPGNIAFSLPQLIRNIRTWQRYHATITPDSDKFDSVQVYNTQQHWLFIAILIGLLVKIPFIGLHMWMPAFYASSTLPMLIIFSSLLSKLGIYGILRIALPLCPEVAISAMPVMLTLASVGVVYAALCAMQSTDVRLMLGYVSMSHLSMTVMGLFTLQSIAIYGATLHMLSHGIVTALVYGILMVHLSSIRRDSYELHNLSGSSRKFVGTLLMLSLLNTIGIPALSNFACELPILVGLFQYSSEQPEAVCYISAALLSILLNTIAVSRLIKTVYAAPVDEPEENCPQLNYAVTIWLVLAALLTIHIGLHPQAYMELLFTGVSPILHAVGVQ